MSRYQFAPGHYIAYLGGIWHIDNHDAKTKVLRLRRLSDRQIISIPMEEAVELLARDAIEFVSPECAVKGALPVADRLMADFASKPAAQKKSAIRRLKYVEAVHAAELESLTEKSLTPLIHNVAKQLGDSKPPSWISVYRWCKQDQRSGHDIRALVGSVDKKGNRRSRLTSEVQELIERAINRVYLSK
ncbi:MAG: hypothetical protein ACLFRH_04335, partial [Halothiobacillaceae bacterium]